MADYLGRLHALGVSERTVEMEREIWTLMQSVSPKAVAFWIADKRDALNDAEFRAIYRDYDAAFDWTADDPRLDGLAERMERWMANRSSPSEGAEKVSPDATIAELVTTSFSVTSPAWDRLIQIMEQRNVGR